MAENKGLKEMRELFLKTQWFGDMERKCTKTKNINPYIDAYVNVFPSDLYLLAWVDNKVCE